MESSDCVIPTFLACKQAPVLYALLTRTADRGNMQRVGRSAAGQYPVLYFGALDFGADEDTSGVDSSIRRFSVSMSWTRNTLLGLCMVLSLIS